MSAASYIPPRDSDFAAFLDNLSTLITATPIAYGLVAGDATIIAGVNTTFQTAYTASINPATRTRPTIAAKDAARTDAEVTIRPYCQQVALDASVSDALKTGLGLNLPNRTRPRIPAPLTAPDLKLVQINPGTVTFMYSDVTTPLSKAKPEGVIGMELWASFGTVAAPTPDNTDYLGTLTKSPQAVALDSANKGKVATLFGRWTTKSGPAGVAQTGPWSTGLAFTVA